MALIRSEGRETIMGVSQRIRPGVVFQCRLIVFKTAFYLFCQGSTNTISRILDTLRGSSKHLAIGIRGALQYSDRSGIFDG